MPCSLSIEHPTYTAAEGWVRSQIPRHLHPMDAVSDLISVCLSIQPVPGLHFAFTTLTWIVNTTKQVQDSKEQIGTLTLGLAQLMKTVNEQYKQGKLIERDTKTALHSLETYVRSLTFSHTK